MGATGGLTWRRGRKGGGLGTTVRRRRKEGGEEGKDVKEGGERDVDVAGKVCESVEELVRAFAAMDHGTRVQLLKQQRRRASLDAVQMREEEARTNFVTT